MRLPDRFNWVVMLTSVSALTAMLLTGCMTLGQKAESMHSALAAGQVGNALAIVEKDDIENKDVLASMNKGMLRRMKGDYQGSNRILEVAKGQIEALYGVSVSEQAGALVVNDTLRSYVGDRYEQVLLHAFMAMNYLQLDDRDAARVEMLQASVKMQEWGEEPEEDPFVRYLSGIIYEVLGEKDQALVSYRMAKNVYKATIDKHKLGVPAVLKNDLLRVLSEQGSVDELAMLKKEFNIKKFQAETSGKDSGELIVLVNSGLAPLRQEASIVANTGGEVVDTVKISVPKYTPPKQRYAVRLSTGQNLSADLELVEDVDALARAALDDDMPVIMSRAIARAVVKHKAQSQVEEKRGAMMGFLATALNVATERADTRSWTTLPQTIQLTRVKLPAGLHKVNIEIYNAAGTLVDTLVKTVQVKSGKSVFLAEHWVAPNMALNVVADKK